MLYYKATAGCGVGVFVGVSVRKRTAPIALILGRVARCAQVVAAAASTRVIQYTVYCPSKQYVVFDFRDRVRTTFLERSGLKETRLYTVVRGGR